MELFGVIELILMLLLLVLCFFEIVLNIGVFVFLENLRKLFEVCFLLWVFDNCDRNVIL